VDILLVDAGLALIALGFVSLLRPLRRLRIRTRRAGALVALWGLALLVTGLALPVRPLRLPGPPMLLDEVVPAYSFGEHHETLIAAPPERVYESVRAVTASEIRLFRLLTWLRSPRIPGRNRESILNPAADAPILEVAVRTSFVVLREEPGREIVVGSIVCCGRSRPPRTALEFASAEGSLARAVMNFHLVPERAGHTRLITQTRIATNDPSSTRRFAAYWRVIYPGSAFIRARWLDAVKRRAEM